MTFGECLRSAREHRNLSYKDLGLLMRPGTGKNFAKYLSDVEREKIRPSYIVIEEIANTMQIVFGYRPGMGWTWRAV